MPALRSSRKAGCARRASMALRLGRGGTNTPGYSSWGIGCTQLHHPHELHHGALPGAYPGHEGVLAWVLACRAMGSPVRWCSVRERTRDARVRHGTVQQHLVAAPLSAQPLPDPPRTPLTPLLQPHLHSRPCAAPPLPGKWPRSRCLPTADTWAPQEP